MTQNGVGSPEILLTENINVTKRTYTARQSSNNVNKRQ